MVGSTLAVPLRVTWQLRSGSMILDVVVVFCCRQAAALA